MHDASNEKSNYVAPGVQHKYDQTLVVFVSKTCNDICDWCFRSRLFNKNEHENDQIADVSDVDNYLSEHPEIQSVLLTGGDSLLAEDDYLRKMIIVLNKHNLISIRFGSRVAIQKTESIRPLLLSVASWTKHKLYLVTHSVHADEVPDNFESLIPNEFTCLNQTPVLKGINDDPAILKNLVLKLTENNIEPYYFFQCRAIEGNEKYSLTFKEGYLLIEELKKRLSGIHKRFRYVMSCDVGKLEIISLSKSPDGVHLKYHQSKNSNEHGKIDLVDMDAVWLNNNEEVFITDGKYSASK